MVSIKCAHGDTVLYPLAVVDMEVEGIPVQVEAAVVDTLPVGVLLGTDVSELPRLLGERASYGFFSQEDVMVVMTRARKKQELQKEILLKEKEALSGVVPKPLNTQGVSTPRTLSQEQKRCIRKDLGTKTQGEGLEYCNMDAAKMKELQEQDLSLSEARGQPGKQRAQKESGSIERDCCTEDGPQEEEGRSRRWNSLFCLRLVGMLHWSCHTIFLLQAI